MHFYGDVEFSTLDMYKQAAEVNLFGLIRMTKTFLPLIKKAKGQLSPLALHGVLKKFAPSNSFRTFRPSPKKKLRMQICCYNSMWHGVMAVQEVCAFDAFFKIQVLFIGLEFLGFCK